MSTNPCSYTSPKPNSPEISYTTSLIERRIRWVYSEDEEEEVRSEWGLVGYSVQGLAEDRE